MALNFKRIIMFIVAMSVLLLFLTVVSSKESRAYDNEFTFMEDGWTIERSGESSYDNVSIRTFNFENLKSGEVITVTNTLPEIKYEHPVMRLYVIHSGVSVYIDDSLRYEYGISDCLDGKIVGFGIQYFDLKPSDAGKKITIKYLVNENKAFSSLVAPFIGPSDVMHSYLFYSNRIILFILIFLIVFGIIMIGAVLWFASKTKKIFQLVSIAMFSTLMGIWSVCNLNLLGVFTDKLILRPYLEFLSLYLAPLFFFMYFWDNGTTRYGFARRVGYKFILTAEILFNAAAIILQIINAVHLPRILLGCHIIMVLMLTYLVTIFIMDIINKQIKNTYIIFGTIILGIFVAFNLITYNLKKYTYLFTNRNYQNSLYLGVFVFIVCMIIDFCSDVLHAYYENAQVDLFGKLIYIDPLTGLNNRRKLEEVLDELDRSKQEYIIIGFDLNFLKKINDNFGHDEGDEYLKSFAGILKRVFSRFGEVVRLGGDEFEVVIANSSGVNIKMLFDLMEDEIMRQNILHEKWNMSVAYGTCYSYDEGVESPRVAMSIADTRMYDMKREMKQRLQNNN